MKKYTYAEAVDVPSVDVGQSIANSVQTALSWGDASTETTLTYVGASEHPSFERYDVVHQVERSVDAIYEQQPIHQIIENVRFPAYYHRAGGYFLLGAREAIAHQALDRLHSGKEPLQAERARISLTDILTLGTATGGWFGNLKIDRVRTVGVFGDSTVVSSDEWERYSALGELKLVLMRFLGEDGASYVVQVLRDRSIVMLNTARSERDALGFLEELESAIDQVIA